MLFTDMGQQDHIIALASADRTVTPSSEASCRNPQNPAQVVNREPFAVFFDEGKSHLLSPAKNTVAFFRISLSSKSNRFSLRSRSFSLAKSACEAIGLQLDTNLNLIGFGLVQVCLHLLL